MERKEFEKIKFFCKKCRKSLRMEYVLTGNEDAPVLENIIIRCNTNRCARVMTLKKYTEKQILEGVDAQGKYFL